MLGTSAHYQFASNRGTIMALKVVVICAALFLAIAAAPTDVEQLERSSPEKEDLQASASHWGGWGGYGGYGGHLGGWGAYYPYYGYWSLPLYGHGYGYGWPYGYGYGHHGYWWK